MFTETNLHRADATETTVGTPAGGRLSVSENDGRVARMEDAGSMPRPASANSRTTMIDAIDWIVLHCLLHRQPDDPQACLPDK